MFKIKTTQINNNKKIKISFTLNDLFNTMNKIEEQKLFLDLLPTLQAVYDIFFFFYSGD